MKILVTGGAGFIGSHLAEHFQGKADVRVMDDLYSGFSRNLEGFACEFLECSILDRDRLREGMKGVDYVFHLAAMVSVPESMQKPAACNEINTTGTLMVLEEAARADVKKMVFSSSAAIYGNNPTLPKTETMAPEPESPYAITKYDGEFYCQMYARHFGLPTVSLRYFNVFGPRQNPRSAYAAAVPIFIERALKNEPLTIHGDGEQTRDFVFVKDIVAANAHFALSSPATGVFNVAGGQSIAINSLAAMILKLTNSRSEIVHAPTRPGDTRHSRANIDKLLFAGFSPKAEFLDSLQATIEWLRSSPR
jgi:UDP-glucose 4-epimerase